MGLFFWANDPGVGGWGEGGRGSGKFDYYQKGAKGLLPGQHNI